MEFLGTQGKWSVISPFISNTHLLLDENNFHIGIIQDEFIKDTQKVKANAKLISKAPEMLKLLVDTLELQKKHIKSGCNTQFINIKEIERLIKEATEI